MHVQTTIGIHTRPDVVATANKNGWVDIREESQTIGDTAIFFTESAVARQFAKAFREMAFMLEEQEAEREVKRLSAVIAATAS